MEKVICLHAWGFPGGASGKEPTPLPPHPDYGGYLRDVGLIPGSGRPPGKRNSN